MPIFCFKPYSLKYKELLILKNIPIIFNYLNVSHAICQYAYLQFTTFKTLINYKAYDLDFGHK